MLILLLSIVLVQVLHPLAMQPAIRSQHMDVRVKNSYNREAAGTIISKARDMSCSLVTSIVLKNNVTLVDIVSSRMQGQFGECCCLMSLPACVMLHCAQQCSMMAASPVQLQPATNSQQKCLLLEVAQNCNRSFVWKHLRSKP